MQTLRFRELLKMRELADFVIGVKLSKRVDVSLLFAGICLAIASLALQVGPEINALAEWLIALLS
jgi:hypothetical protein